MNNKQIKIERCKNGFLVENKLGKFVFKDAAELLKQMAKEIEEKLNPGEKLTIEYSKDGKQD